MSPYPNIFLYLKDISWSSILFLCNKIFVNQILIFLNFCDWNSLLKIVFPLGWFRVTMFWYTSNQNKLNISWILESAYVVQSLSHVRLFATPWTTAHQASLSFTLPQSLLKPMSIKLVMPSNHLILCHPLLLLPSIFPSIRVFSNELALHIRWPKYWSFSFSISPSNEYSGLISFRINWFDLLAVWGECL